MITRNKLWILLAAAGVILIGWIFVIASFASEPTDEGKAPAQTTEVIQTVPSTTETLATPGGETTVAETTEASATPPDETGGTTAIARTMPAEPDPNYAGSQGPPEQEAMVHDPLDTGAKPGALGKTDLERVKVAVDLYVNTAFGFTGGPSEKAETRYRNLLFQTVMAFDFSKKNLSPGMTAIEKFAEKISTEGTDSEAKLQSVKIVEQSLDEVLLDATFTVKEKGGEQQYRQRLTVVPWQATWKVKYAQELEEVV